MVYTWANDTTSKLEVDRYPLHQTDGHWRQTQQAADFDETPPLKPWQLNNTMNSEHTEQVKAW